MNALTKPALTAVAERPRTRTESFVMQVLPPERRGEIARSLPSHIKFDRFERGLTNAVMQNPKLLNCDPRLVFREVAKLVGLGLVLDPQLGEAYLFPAAGGEPQARVGYRGLMKLARQSGEIATIYPHEVCANDPFEVSLGTGKSLVHKPDMFSERGDVVGFYAVAQYKDGVVDFEVMGKRQIDAIRNRSDGYKAFKAGRIRSNPWDSDYDEMAKKTAIRRLCKRLPMSPELARAITLEDEADAMVDVTPEKPRLTAGETLAQMPDDEIPAGKPEDGDGITDIPDSAGDNGAPSAAEAPEAAAPSQPTVSGDATPALDFGAPEPPPFDVELASEAIRRQVETFKSAKAIDNYLAVVMRDEMEKIEAAAPELAKFIRAKADAAKKALGR